MPRGKPINPKEYDKSKLELLYKSKSLRDIALLLNLSHTGTKYLFQKLEIKCRTRSEAAHLSKRIYYCGEKHSSWKGGRIKHHGYIMIYNPNHSRTSKGHPYVYEHILIWEEHHKKILPKGCVIHHLNGITDDNRPENLMAFPNNEHSELSHNYIHELQNRIRELEKSLNRAMS
jgi:hypothetical protein